MPFDLPAALLQDRLTIGIADRRLQCSANDSTEVDKHSAFFFAVRTSSTVSNLLYGRAGTPTAFVIRRYRDQCVEFLQFDCSKVRLP
jgi:hypothetical protein